MALGARPTAAAPTSRPARGVLVAGAVLVLALAVRLAWLAAHRHLVLANDPADYQRLAVSIASGHGFGTTHVAPGGGPTAFRPPLWPLFLAGLYWVAGVHVTLARVVEALLGTVTVGLIGVLARQLWSGAAAVAAMVIAAVYPPLLLAGGSLLSESLSLPLELGSLAAALAARRSALPWRWVVPAGVLAGLDVLARPDSFILLVPIGVLLARGRRVPVEDRALPLPLPLPRPRRPLPWVWSRAVAVLVAGVVVTPWLVRDEMVMHRFVPLTTQGGLVASGTYNDTAAHDPRFPAAWRPTNLVPEYLPLLRGTEVEEEAALRKASLHYISAHPLYPLRVAGWNLLRLFDLTGLSDPRGSWGANGYTARSADLDAYGLAGIGFLLVVGTIAWLVRRSRRGPAGRPDSDRSLVGDLHAGGRWPVGLAPVLVVLVTIPVLGESRLRVGVDPFLVLGAAWAVLQLAPRRLRLPPGPATRPEAAVPA